VLAIVSNPILHQITNNCEYIKIKSNGPWIYNRSYDVIYDFLVQEPFIGLDYLDQVKEKNVFAHVILLKQIYHYKFTNGTL
jgi:hypothetical protein